MKTIWAVVDLHMFAIAFADSDTCLAVGIAVVGTYLAVVVTAAGRGVASTELSLHLVAGIAATA